MSELSPAQRTRNQWLVVSRIVGGFTLVVAAIVLPIWGLDYKRGGDSAVWERAAGNIESAEVRTDRVRRSTVYRPVVVYRFRVDGREHTGHRIFFGSSSFQREEEAKEYAAKYPVGKAVEVRYQAGRPEMSVLEPGPPRDGNFVLGIGAVALTLGLTLSGLGFTRRLARPGDPE